MKTIFADAFFYIAILNHRDAAHAEAVQWAEEFDGRMVTTEWVLMEVGDALARSQFLRAKFVQLMADLTASERTTIISSSHDLFAAGLELYAQRADKEWSLTDCISFVVMKREGLTDALTGDKHFEQAGFLKLL